MSGNTMPAAASEPVLLSSSLGGYLAARHAQQRHDYPDAVAFIDKALAADPNNFDLQRRAFALRIAEGRIGDAAPLAPGLATHDGQGGLAGLVLIEQAVKRGDFATAMKAAAKTPREGAQRFAVPLLLAWAQTGAGKPDLAAKTVGTLGETRGLGPLLDLHDTLIADVGRQTAKAATGYKKLVEREKPPTIRTADLAGNFYERQGNAAAARALYELIAATDDSDVARQGLERLRQSVKPAPIIGTPADGAAEALFDLASLLNQAETMDAALIYVRLALDLKPDYVLAQLLLAEIGEQQSRLTDALAIYRAIPPASPFAWTARLRAALVLDALDRTDEAGAQLNAMAVERPQRPDALIELADIERGHSRFPEAAATYTRALERIPNPTTRSWRLFYSRGISYERSGQWPKAEADLQRALQLQPDQAQVLNYLGYTWIDKGENLPEGMKMIERAVQLRPNDGYIVDSLGWAFFRLGQYKRAAAILEQAIELMPEDPTLNDHLGDAYWRTGREAEARYQWRRALQFKPEPGEVKTIEAKLDRGLAPPAAAAGGG